jgi:hypothetical protein
MVQINPQLQIVSHSFRVDSAIVTIACYVLQLRQVIVRPPIYVPRHPRSCHFCRSTCVLGDLDVYTTSMYSDTGHKAPYARCHMEKIGNTGK